MKDKSPRLTNCDNLVNDPVVNDGSFVAMPNAFTPNNDGLNDIFRPLVSKIAKIKFSVTTERNEPIFHTETLGEGWRPISGFTAGTKYYYRVESETLSGRKIGLCGYVYPLLVCLQSNIDRATLNFEDELDPSGNFTIPSAENLPDCN
jgi:hypothetical protein